MSRQSDEKIRADRTAEFESRKSYAARAQSAAKKAIDEDDPYAVPVFASQEYAPQDAKMSPADRMRRLHKASTGADPTSYLIGLNLRVGKWFDQINDDELYAVLKCYKSYPFLGTETAILAQVEENRSRSAVKAGEVLANSQARTIGMYISACKVALEGGIFADLKPATWTPNWTQVGDTRSFKEAMGGITLEMTANTSNDKEFLYWKSTFAVVSFSDLTAICTIRIQAASTLLAKYKPQGIPKEAGSMIPNVPGKAFSVACNIYPDVKPAEEGLVQQALIPDFRMFLLQIRKDTESGTVAKIQNYIVSTLFSFMKSIDSKSFAKYEGKLVNLNKDAQGSFHPFVTDYFLMLRSQRASLRNLVRMLSPNQKSGSLKSQVRHTPDIMYPTR